jgi:hypothetical protein
MFSFDDNRKEAEGRDQKKGSGRSRWKVSDKDDRGTCVIGDGVGRK